MAGGKRFEMSITVRRATAGDAHDFAYVLCESWKAAYKDIITHYDNIPMCFGVAFKHNKIATNSVAEWIKYFEHDWNDLSERTKQTFKPRYDVIMDVLFGALI